MEAHIKKRKHRWIEIEMAMLCFGLSGLFYELNLTGIAIAVFGFGIAFNSIAMKRWWQVIMLGR